MDTSVWVDILRLDDIAAQLEVGRLMTSRQAATIGMIYVEVLRGARNQEEYERLRRRMGLLQHIEGTPITWERASHLLFDLNRQGMPIPVADAIIAAHALEGDHSVFTRDEHFRRVPGLRLHDIPGSVG